MKTQYQILSLFLLLFCSQPLWSQVSLRQDGLLADSTAQLDIQSTEQGFLMPRMVESQRLAIPSPANGLWLFQVDSQSGFRYYSDSTGNWERMVRENEINIAEPRTPIDELDPDGNGSLIIDKPGSYYLRENLIVNANDGIRINSDNVTLDLNGYTVLRGADGSGNGITNIGSQNNITIKNGTVRGFTDMGIDLLNSPNCLIKNVKVKDNGEDGITVDENSLVINCIATGNGEHGIQLFGEGSIVRDGTFSHNGFDGINATAGSTIYNCVASHNRTDGIDVFDGSRIEGCTVFENGNYGMDLSRGTLCINNTVYRNAQHGIVGSSGSLIMNNSSNENGTCIDNVTCDSNGGLGSNTNHGVGIRTFSNTVVLNNQCNGNYFGIVNLGTDVAVINNQVQFNKHAGIHVQTSGSIFIGNTGQGNGYSQAPGVSDISSSGYPLGNIVFRSSAFSGGAIAPIIDVS
ncbi:MAG: right-handed parallel beta-helix repeat-containing protein, partial [Bacteroidota bacterium]